MALPAERILIVGGGFTGMSAAIALTRLGAQVDIAEIDPNWRTDGAGITVSGPSLRAIEQLGLLSTFMELGATHDGFEQYTADGKLLMRIPNTQVPRTEIKGAGGIMRPAFAKALGEATLAAGVNVMLGQSYKTIKDGEDSVKVTFSDDSEKEYDLVIGADGLFSSVRKDYFPGAPKPEYTGQGVWRAVVPRFGTEAAAQFLGPRGKVGFTPVSDTEMYLYYTDTRPEKPWFEPEQLLPELKRLLQDFTAPLCLKVRESLNEDSQILFRPLEGMLMPRPWYRGRVLLVGDAVHATTPHLASGAGMGHEDAVVLADEFAKGGDLQTALDRYQNRRWARCQMIVKNSHRLGEIELAGGPFEEHGQIMALSMAGLMAPI